MDNVKILYWLAEILASDQVQPNIIAVHGHIVILVGDKWSSFVSKALRIWLQLFGRLPIVSPPQYRSSVNLATILDCSHRALLGQFQILAYSWGNVCTHVSLEIG